MPMALLRPGLPGWRMLTPIRTPSIISKRNVSTSSWERHLNRPIQIYHSKINNPYLNLSIEHHLLQKSSPESTILFIYFNRPSVVIGRNQNPFKEVNLRRLSKGVPAKNKTTEPAGPALFRPREPVDLVRRRSGGGTVFHDSGNANWCVICPPGAFDRDKHAEMVVRALKALKVQGVRVNERHDIVQDVTEEGELRTYKVSGSAYKLTRTRSLHHGTCLLDSMPSAKISELLRSPAEPFIKSKGVDSVRSKIRNVNVDRREFRMAVIDEFRKMYRANIPYTTLTGPDVVDIENIKNGFKELRSQEWIYGQTPQFTVSWQPTAEDPRPRPHNALSDHIDEDYVSSFHMRFTVRHGAINEAFLWGLDFAESIDDSKRAVKEAFVNVPVHRLDFLPKILPLIKHEPESLKKAVQMSDFLNGVFGNNPSPLRERYLGPKNAVELAIEQAMAAAAAAEPNKGGEEEEEDRILTEPQEEVEEEGGGGHDVGSETNSRELKQEWSQEEVREKLQELIKDSK